MHLIVISLLVIFLLQIIYLILYEPHKIKVMIGGTPDLTIFSKANECKNIVSKLF